MRTVDPFAIRRVGDPHRSRRLISPGARIPQQDSHVRNLRQNRSRSIKGIVPVAARCAGRCELLSAADFTTLYHFPQRLDNRTIDQAVDEKASSLPGSRPRGPQRAHVPSAGMPGSACEGAFS